MNNVILCANYGTFPIIRGGGGRVLAILFGPPSKFALMAFSKNSFTAYAEKNGLRG